MKKFTAKQRLVLEAARNNKCLAAKASVRSKRVYNVVIDFEAGYFNDQYDRLEDLGYVVLGAYCDGTWGPRFVHVTAAGQAALKA